MRRTYWRAVGLFFFAWLTVQCFLSLRWKAGWEGLRTLWRRLRPPKPLKFLQMQMPLFEVAVNPTIKLSDIKARRFHIIDRANWIEIMECCRCGWEGQRTDLTHMPPVRRSLCPVCLSKHVECIVEEQVVEGDIILYREVEDISTSCV